MVPTPQPRLLKSWALPVLFGLLMAFAYSSRWIYPVYKEKTSHGKYVFSIPRLPGDDYYSYYAKIRKIIDGRFFEFDPMVYENRYRPSTHSNFHFAFILGSIGGWVTGKTEHAFYFNYFVFPLLNFLLIFLLLLEFTPDRSLACLLTVYAMVTGMFYLSNDFAYYLGSHKGFHFLGYLHHAFDDKARDLLSLTFLYRTPHVLITNVPLILFAYLLLLSLERKNVSRGIWIGLGFSLGISSCTSSANFIASYGIFVFALLFCRPEKKKWRSYLQVFLGACVLSLPGVWLQVQTASLMKELSAMTLPWPPSPKYGWSFFRDVLYILLPAFLLSILRVRHWRFIAGSLTAIALGFIAMHIAHGQLYSGRLITTGSEILIGTLVLGGLASLYSRVLPRLPVWVARWSAAVCCAITFVFVAVLIGNQYRIREYYVPAYSRGFQDLCEWSRHARSPAVALTMDLDLLLDLPHCGPLYLYMPQALLSPTPRAERFQRLFETSRFHGLSESDFKAMTESMLPVYDFKRYLAYTPPDKLTPQEREDEPHALLNFLLFYGQFARVKPSAEVLETLNSGYRDLVQSRKGLSYRADYLIVSNKFLGFVKDGSRAWALLHSEAPEYANDEYRVYRIGGG